MEGKVARRKVWDDKRERTDGVCDRVLVIGLRVKGMRRVAVDLGDDAKSRFVKLHVNSMQLIGIHDRAHALARAHPTLAGNQDVGHLEDVAVCASAPKDK